MDFTLTTYRQLIKALKNQGFLFQTFAEFLERPTGKSIVLRHDVDKLPKNSLKFAKIQSEEGVKGTYFFRIVKENWNEVIIRQIAEMGHEIGYHYEDLSFAWAKLKAQGSGLRAQGSKKYEVGSKEYEEYEKDLAGIAIESFTKNLEKLRKITPVKTICMHGSPLSRWDSRLLWKYYDYRDFGIIGEPYFDVDYNDVLYLTDTGRRWDGESVSIRDKASGFRFQATGEKEWESGRVGDGEKNQKSIQDITPSLPHPLTPSISLKFHSTFDIIKAAKGGKLPDKIMMTFHPQRWTDRPWPWVRELVWQNVKNVGKYLLIRMKAEGGRLQV